MGVEIRKVRERIEEVEGDIDNDLAMAQSPEQKDRMIEDMLMQVKKQDLEAEFLRKKNEFEIKEHLVQGPLAVDLRSVQYQLNYLEDINLRITRLSEITRVRKPEQVPLLQADCQDLKRKGMDLDKRIKAKGDDLKPLRDFVRNATYPKFKPDVIQDKIDELKRENVEVEHLNEETDKLARDVDHLRKRELSVREELRVRLSKECNKELTVTRTTLKKVDEKATKAQEVLDIVKTQIDDKLKTLDPASIDFLSIEALRKEHEARQATMNEMYQSKHKCNWEQKRMEDHLKDPKLGLEPVVILADEEVPQHREDVNKLNVERDRFLDDLMRFRKRLDEAKRQAARNRLEDLKKRLEADKMGNDELAYKLNSLEIDASDLLKTADGLKGSVKDPIRQKRLEGITAEIKDPILRETAGLQKDQRDNIGKKQLGPLEKKIYALDLQNPDEATIEKLRAELEAAENCMQADNQRADELRDKLRPLKNQVGDLERSLGDKKADLERAMRNLNDDLRELDKRIGICDKNLKSTANVQGEI